MTDKNCEEEKYFNKIKIIYENCKDTFILPIIINDVEYIDFIISVIKEIIPDINIFSGNILSIDEFNSSLKNTATLLYNLDGLNVNSSFDDKDVKIRFLKVLNMVRDNVFLKYNSKFIIILKEDDYDLFLKHCNDLESYCISNINFNELYINKDNLSVSDAKKRYFLDR